MSAGGSDSETAVQNGVRRRSRNQGTLGARGGAEFGQVAFKIGKSPFDTYADLNFVETGQFEGSEPALLITSLYLRTIS